MARQTRKKSNMRKKRNIRKTIKQNGGWLFSKKPLILTPEEQLKNDALENLILNEKSLGSIENNEIVGKYTYLVEKKMLSASSPEYNIYVKVKIGEDITSGH